MDLWLLMTLPLAPGAVPASSTTTRGKLAVKTVQVVLLAKLRPQVVLLLQLLVLPGHLSKSQLRVIHVV
jgi:hypothetical protein